jgi:hypothetical protein
MAKPPMSAIVSPDAALQNPYPYVFVHGDGTIRELHATEMTYLQTPFSPFDGGRPYIKRAYQSRNAFGSIEGFCLRSEIPAGLVIAPPQDANPNPPLTKANLVELLRQKTSGFAITERTDGTVSMKRRETP